MKILSKIARRNNGNELPGRGEYVEMDLFDTERNPLKFPTGGGSVWERHDYDIAVPFDIPPMDGNPGASNPILFRQDLEIGRPSLGVVFIGGKFYVESGAEHAEDFYKRVMTKINVEATAGITPTTLGISEEAYINDNLLTHQLQGAYSIGVLNPGLYGVSVWVYSEWNEYTDSAPVASMTELVATVALLPAGLGGPGGGGWEGSGV